MMDENNMDAIYEFGKDIVINARDSAIGEIEDLLKGKAFGNIRKKLFEEVKKMHLDEQKLKIITLLVADGIDAMMHRLFVNFDESFGKYRIVTKDKKENDFNIVTESDGLPYGYYEFIDEFSKYKSIDDSIRKIIYKSLDNNNEITRDIIEEYLPPEEWKLEKD